MAPVTRKAAKKDPVVTESEMIAVPKEKNSIRPNELGNMVLLIILYMIQGVPLGLAMGSVPFILKKRLSYAELATFSLTAYPYSLKLFWSPIVDSIYFKNFGRRKSWIIPIQLILALLFYSFGAYIDDYLGSGNPIDITFITAMFVLIVFLAATQDIAVDGWALTLLDEDRKSYASTCQTIGLNTGYFLSYSVFLAFNSVTFCNNYFRKEPLNYPMVSLGGFMELWAIIYAAVTIWLVFFKREKREIGTSDVTVSQVYYDIWEVICLPNMKWLLLVLMTAKLGFSAHDSATSYKLMEKGLREEDLGLTALINFPLQIVFGYYAAKMSKEPHRLRPWKFAFIGRLVVSILGPLLVFYFPQKLTHNSLLLAILLSIMGSFFSTVQFVSMGAFFAHISDPTIGGTYMTLLNTLSNFGGTYPQFFILKAIDYFTVANCIPSKDSSFQNPFSCSGKASKDKCTKLLGDCVITRDGYFVLAIACSLIGILIFYLNRPAIRILEKLPIKKWRISHRK